MAERPTISKDIYGFLNEFLIQRADIISFSQVAMIKQKIVMEEKWITLARFQRVFAVYQILPGPEAAELCMFFGCLSNGRVGGIIAGLAFILPGFVLMLVASYLYTLTGLENRYFNASFRVLQLIVAAMVNLK